MFCAIISVIQNIVGVSLAKVLNIKPLLGLTAGSMSMEGGHGNAAAYGKTIQDLGIDSALTSGSCSCNFRSCIWRAYRWSSCKIFNQTL